MKKGFAKFGIKVNFDWDKLDEASERERSCGQKERMTESQAESRVRSLERKYRIPYDAYRCKYCVKIDDLQCYHVGHSTRWVYLSDKYR